MKTLQVLVLSFLALLGQVIPSRGQDIVFTNAGWYLTGDFDEAITNDVNGGGTNEGLARPAGIPDMPNIAEAITPEIQALADGLQDDPLNIYNYVHDRIRHVLYFGSKKGAQLTLLEKSGNDFDQCALLVALFRAAGHTNASYQFGWVPMPYDNPDGSNRDLRHWLKLSLTNSNWSTTGAYLHNAFANASYPADRYNLGNNIFAFQRVWVTLAEGGTNYFFDPAFKVSERIEGIDVAAATGLSSNTLMSAAGGTDAGLYVTNVSEAALRSTLTAYTTNWLGYLQHNFPNASVEEVLGGYYIVPSTNTALSQSLSFASTNMDGTMPVINWPSLPTNMMSSLTVTFLTTNYQCFIPQLLGQKLSLSVSNNGLAQLWQDDILLAQGNTGGGSGSFNVGLNITHPRGSWDTTNNVFIPGTVGQSVTKTYQKANATYAILYSFSPDWRWLHERQRRLDAYRQQGFSDTSRQVVSESLNIMGLNWQIQLEAVNQILAHKIGVVPLFNHRMGRMSQENGSGYYVDVYMASASPVSTDGLSDNHVQKWADHISFFASAMEHGLSSSFRKRTWSEPRQPSFSNWPIPTVRPSIWQTAPIGHPSTADW